VLGHEGRTLEMQDARGGCGEQIVGRQDGHPPGHQAIASLLKGTAPGVGGGQDIARLLARGLLAVVGLDLDSFPGGKRQVKAVASQDEAERQGVGPGRDPFDRDFDRHRMRGIDRQRQRQALDDGKGEWVGIDIGALDPDKVRIDLDVDLFGGKPHQRIEPRQEGQHQGIQDEGERGPA
jgi:hypothetical protein